MVVVEEYHEDVADTGEEKEVLAEMKSVEGTRKEVVEGVIGGAPVTSATRGE